MSKEWRLENNDAPGPLFWTTVESKVMLRLAGITFQHMPDARDEMETSADPMTTGLCPKHGGRVSVLRTPLLSHVGPSLGPQ